MECLEGVDCEPAQGDGPSGGSGFSVWYQLHSWHAVTYSVTVTDETATGIRVALYINWDGWMMHQSPVRDGEAPFPARAVGDAHPYRLDAVGLVGGVVVMCGCCRCDSCVHGLCPSCDR